MATDPRLAQRQRGRLTRGQRGRLTRGLDRRRGEVKIPGTLDQLHQADVRVLVALGRRGNLLDQLAFPGRPVPDFQVRNHADKILGRRRVVVTVDSEEAEELRDWLTRGAKLNIRVLHPGSEAELIGRDDDTIGVAAAVVTFTPDPFHGVVEPLDAVQVIDAGQLRETGNFDSLLEANRKDSLGGNVAIVRVSTYFGFVLLLHGGSPV